LQECQVFGTLLLEIIMREYQSTTSFDRAKERAASGWHDITTPVNLDQKSPASEVPLVKEHLGGVTTESLVDGVLTILIQPQLIDKVTLDDQPPTLHQRTLIDQSPITLTHQYVGEVDVFTVKSELESQPTRNFVISGDFLVVNESTDGNPHAVMIDLLTGETLCNSQLQAGKENYLPPFVEPERLDRFRATAAQVATNSPDYSFVALMGLTNPLSYLGLRTEQPAQQVAL